jgi:hypothetical protein
MGWCLDCHRHPENNLRPREQVFNLNWTARDENAQSFIAKYGNPPDAKQDLSNREKLTQQEIGATLKNAWHVNPPDTNCFGCHR